MTIAADEMQDCQVIIFLPNGVGTGTTAAVNVQKSFTTAVMKRIEIGVEQGTYTKMGM